MYYAYFIENFLFRIRLQLEFVVKSSNRLLTVINDIITEANSLLKYLSEGISQKRQRRIPENSSDKDSKEMGNSKYSYFLKNFLIDKWLNISKIFAPKAKEEECFTKWCQTIEEFDNKEKNL